MQHTISRRILAAVVCASVAHAAAGATNPFTEEFVSDAAGWRDIDGLDTLTWVATGGFDGGSYVSTTWTVPDPLPAFGATLFRAQDEFGSSGGAFEGNWISDAHVKAFSFRLRHDGSEAIDVFARFSGPANFPGAAGVPFFSIEPDAWTEITIPIFDGSPNLIFEGPGLTFADVFANIGHVQVGIIPTADLIGESITFDLDKVSITPAPAAWVPLGLALVAARRRRRQVRAPRAP